MGHEPTAAQEEPGLMLVLLMAAMAGAGAGVCFGAAQWFILRRGAGDAFVGVLAASLDLGVALPDALVRASVAAGLACTRLGAQTSQPQRPEIEARQSEISALALD
jgi:hypothetical protein